MNEEGVVGFSRKGIEEKKRLSAIALMASVSWHRCQNPLLSIFETYYPYIVSQARGQHARESEIDCIFIQRML
jgi:hypothetical protein